jgi:thiamine biosynthesis lipoprotein
MASPLRLTVTGDAGQARTAALAWQAVRETFEAAEQALSRFREDSDLTSLNRSCGRPTATRSRLLVRALTVADRAHRRTAGRFDPRVLGDLERLGLHGAAIPGVPARIRAADAGHDRILQRAGRAGPVWIDVPVDLGGIGKGLALRWAARSAAAPLGELLSRGGGFLLDAGQDLVTRGLGPDGEPFLVDVEDPAGALESLAVIRLPRDGAVATSSVRLRRWTAPDGRQAHHLIDPRTGEPGGAGLQAVTVAGVDPAWAEVWSKSLFVEGVRRIGPAARHEGLAAWWVTADQVLEMTPAARSLTVWLAPSQHSRPASTDGWPPGPTGARATTR